MGYGQGSVAGQMPLFQGDTSTTTKHTAIPIYRVSLVREGKVQGTYGKITSSAAASMLLQTYLSHVDREHFVVVLLDRKNQVIGLNTVSIGSLTASVVHPREVFKPAILSNAAAVILCHNHPSGSPLPSNEDRVLTARLVEAGKLLGINVLDHIILGDESQRYFSFADEGLLR
jgi:DNA repair protein RadC